MKTYRYIVNLLAGLSMMAAVAGCQEELSSEGQAVLTEQTVLTFEAQNAAEQVISLVADGKWTVEVSADWITVTPLSGDGHTDVTVAVTDNIKNGAMDEPRTGTVRFSAADGRNYGYLSYAVCNVTVNQKGDNYLLVTTQTTVTETAALWDSEPAKVKDAQVVAVADGGFVISDGTTNMFVSSSASVAVGDMISLNGVKTTVNDLPSFIGDEIVVLSSSEVTYPEATDINAELGSYTADKVGYVSVRGTLIGTQLLGLEGSPAKGVEVVEATKAMKLDKVAVHALDISGYWLGFNGTNHVIAIASYVDNGENPDICVDFPFRDDFSWLAPFVEEAKTVVAEKKWPIDAVGENVNTGTNLPNLYTDLSSCLAEFHNRGYADYMPEYQSIFLADGYLKFSISKKPTGIVLPLLAIQGEQDIYVQFNWCAEKNGSGVIDGVNMVVEIDGPGTFEKPSKDDPSMCESIATTQVAEQLAWQYASVRINGATMATRISIHPVETSGMRRYYLDNINVVSLADAVPANLTIEGPADDIFRFEGTPEGPQTFTVTSDKEFFVNSSANWCKLDVTQGAAYEKTPITVTCEASTLSTMRETYITVSSGSTTRRFNVIQSAAGTELAPFISIVGGNSTNIDEFDNDLSIQVQSNVEYQVEISEGSDWLSVVPQTKALVEVATINLKAAANTQPMQRTGKVRIFNEEEQIEAVYTVIQKKKLDFVDLAKWNLTAETIEAHSATFATTGREEGFGDAYITADAGVGKLEYYQVDKTGFTDIQDKDVYRSVNADGYAVCKNNWEGDYWLFSSSREGGEAIPAGTQYEVIFTTRISKAGPALWIAEYLDGEEWKPAGAVTAKTVGDSEVQYNIEHSNTDPITNEFAFTTEKSMTEFKFRVRCVTAWRYNGNLPAQPAAGNQRIQDEAKIRALYKD